MQLDGSGKRENPLRSIRRNTGQNHPETDGSGIPVSVRRLERFWRDGRLVSFLLEFFSGRRGSVDRDQAVSTVKTGRGVDASLVEFVLAVLFFEVGVRTGRFRRRIEIIKIRLVESRVSLIQDHVRMNLIVQVGRSFSLQNLER